MPRTLCPYCTYPLTTCLCEAIHKVENHTRVVVLQHPAEANHAKNTVKLLRLILTNIEVIVGEQAEDFSQIKQCLLHNAQDAYLIFSADDAAELETVACTSVASPSTLVLIDGSWRKAKKIFFLNPWLSALPCIKISSKKSIYKIRRTMVDNSLSTIEAVAYCLQAYEGVSPSPFLGALDAMMNRHLKYLNPVDD